MTFWKLCRYIQRRAASCPRGCTSGAVLADLRPGAEGRSLHGSRGPPSLSWLCHHSLCPWDHPCSLLRQRGPDLPWQGQAVLGIHLWGTVGRGPRCWDPGDSPTAGAAPSPPGCLVQPTWGCFLVPRSGLSWNPRLLSQVPGMAPLPGLGSGYHLADPRQRPHRGRVVREK